ncbi:MAG: methionyl-tRNA formyltransferase [Rickettsiales bacterium]|jgi:methionyl-tRNA formyltransferase|nr:methionyl-tRNA formyltransferase [Rickettsiales bacterium]
MRIVFMGTPEFAVPFLEKLLNDHRDIVGVYTRKPKGKERGQRLQNTPIHSLAAARNIPVSTPGTFKNGKNLDNLKALRPDLIIVVAYGLLLPEELLNMPKYGCINVHPSLLPRWRGCAPIERCLMSDDTETGICIVRIAEILDSGDIISSTRIPIEMDTDAESLRRKMAIIGVDMLMEAVEAIETKDSVPAIKQNDSLATFSEKITDEDALVNWQNDNVGRIHRKIMALNDSVGVHVVHGSNRLKLVRSRYVQAVTRNDMVGRIIDKNFSIGCRDGILEILEIQREGRKPLDIKNFLNGYRFNIGDQIR